MSTLYARYKKYAPGGPIDPNKFANSAMVGAGAATGLIDAFDAPNEFGNQSALGTIGKSALQMGAAGASIGGPVGAAIGGGLGLVTGFLKSRSNAKAEEGMRTDIKNRQLMADTSMSNARIAGDPSLLNGYKNAQMFATGGEIGGKGNTGKRVDKVPDGYNYEREDGGKKYYTRKSSVELPLAAGTGSGGKEYETFLQKQLSNGVSPEELVTKKYITPDKVGSYTQFYKPITDTVYTEQVPSTPVNVPVPVPAAAQRGQPIYSANKHIAGEVFYGTRDSKDITDGGTLNTAPQNARIKFRNDFGYTGEEVEIPGSEVQKYLGTSHTFGNDALQKELMGRSAKVTKMAAGGNIKTPLAAAYASGGQVIPTSSGTTEVEGNSHDEGGVQLPQLRAEVEGGETTSGNFVFSKELGFANLHKPIAKAKGIIEKKPQTAERIAAMNLLNKQENKLALSQEYLKKRMGIQ